MATTQPQRKKVLYLITKSNFGGAQRYVYDLATALPREKYEAVVAFGGTGAPGSKPGQLAEMLGEANVSTVYLSTLGRDYSIMDVRAFFEILQLIKIERPDVLHLNSSKAGGLGALAGRLCHVPHIIYTAHGWPFWEERNIVWVFTARLFSWLTALLSHKIIVVSDYDLSVAKKMPFAAHKTIRIYNGIDIRFPLGSGQAIRDNFPKGVRVIGTIGELTKNKNQISLIEQAKKDPAMYVAIVGAGEDRLYLMKKIEEYGLKNRVKLFGFMPASEVLRGFDAFTLPSLKEGLPYVLLEARLAGLPIVANRVGGVGEILDANDLEMFSLKQMLEKTFALYERA